MDPNATLDDLLSALDDYTADNYADGACETFEVIDELATDLIEWAKRGGFTPECSGDEVKVLFAGSDFLQKEGNTYTANSLALLAGWIQVGALDVDHPDYD